MIALAGAAAIGALVPSRAGAASLSGDQLGRLAHGDLVRVPLDLDLPQGDYFGGLSYAVVHAPPSAVMAVVTDPATYASILPMTLETKLLASRGNDKQVYFRQGAKLASAAYVLIIRRESPSLIRYWLDRSRPHEIDDLWGYFRVQPWGPDASLLTYAALLHLDAGMTKMLFSEAIRRYALSTPGLVRAYVQGHRAP